MGDRPRLPAPTNKIMEFPGDAREFKVLVPFCIEQRHEEKTFTSTGPGASRWEDNASIQDGRQEIPVGTRLTAEELFRCWLAVGDCIPGWRVIQRRMDRDNRLAFKEQCEEFIKFLIAQGMLALEKE